MFVFIRPPVSALERAAIFVGNALGHTLPTHQEIEASRRSGQKAPDPCSCILTSGHNRLNKIPGLEAKVNLLARPVGDGKAVFVRPTHLPGAPPFGRPNLHHRGDGRKLIGRAFPDAKRIKVMFFGELMLYPLFLGAST